MARQAERGVTLDALVLRTVRTMPGGTAAGYAEHLHRGYSKVHAALRAWHRMGRIRRVRAEPDGEGRPPHLWFPVN